MTEKLCINCKHYYNPYTTHRCRRPKEQNTSFITGKVEIRPDYLLCEIERKNLKEVDRCGEEGKYYEPKKSFWERLRDFITKSL